MSNRFLLEAKNIIKTFPPTVALNDVHFCLRPGEIHGLMGENGSGKSTMCSIVSGIYPYDSGELFLDGEPYCPKNMIDAAAKGVCMIVQEQGTFASTTVAENIFIGKEKQFHNGIRLDTKKMANAAQKILDELQMQHIDARMTCGRLSFEDRKLVEIARAMYSDPKVLIIDETTSALSKNGRDILYGLMEKMKSEGKSVIFISHDIDELMEKCDYLTVFRDGIYIDEVPKEKFNADLIKQLMVGREMAGAYYREDFKPSHEDEVVLSVEHITQGIVTDVSFDAYKGEILGIGGLNECGMHELGKLIFGLEPRTIGVTRYHGGVEFKNPTDAMKLGIGYISKDRDKEAILTAASIRDNINICVIGSTVLSILLFWKQLKAKNLRELISTGAADSIHMSLTVAAICGFAGVVTNTEAFTTMLNAITGINMSPMLICAVVVAVMCMLTGGSSTGQLISLPLIAPKLLDLGLNVNAIHRIACFAATTLDSMPYSGAILMLLPMCRMKLKEIYPPMFITTVIATTCGTIAVIVMCALFPGLC